MDRLPDERLAELDQYFGEVIAESRDPIWADVLTVIKELRQRRSIEEERMRAFLANPDGPQAA